MRTAYHEQLVALAAEIAKMCALATVALDRATRALLRADRLVADQVVADHAQLVATGAHAEEASVVLLALQAPVASELRAVVTSIQNVADVERMGALALHIAKIAQRRHPDYAVPEEVRGYFAEMGKVAKELGTVAQEALLTRDPEIAAGLAHQDDAIDDLHRHLFTVLLDRNWGHGVTAAVDVTLLSRFYERFADHAVEIGRRIVFQVTGEQPASDARS